MGLDGVSKGLHAGTFVIICSIYRLFCAYGATQTLANRKNSTRKPFVCLTYSPCSGQVL